MEIVPFNFGTHEVRTITINGEPWFVLTDIAAALDIASVGRLAARLDSTVRQAHTIQDRLGREREVTIVNEPGMYEVVIRSDKPGATEFRRWITHDVIPTIRKTGSYGVQRALPASFSEALRELANEVEAHEVTKAELKAVEPKRIFADAVATSPGTILVGELAKILRGNGVEIGQNRLFDWLRVNGYLIRRDGSDRNMPTQRSMELGLFEIKETAVTHSDGHVTISKTPKVTGKGQQYFVNLFLADEVA